MIRLLISKRRDADWVSSSWYGKNGGYVQWAKKYNVKQFAESILFLQQHAIHDKKTLDALVDGSSAKYHELTKTIKDAEEKMAANKVIKTHIINYAKTRETYITYRKSGYSKKFFEAHRDEITLHKAAKEAFSKLPDGKIPKVKDLNEEFVRLLSEKKAAYTTCAAISTAAALFPCMPTRRRSSSRRGRTSLRRCWRSCKRRRSSFFWSTSSLTRGICGAAS